jgi:hypothetical protein
VPLELQGPLPMEVVQQVVDQPEPLLRPRLLDPRHFQHQLRRLALRVRRPRPRVRRHHLRLPPPTLP